MAHFGAVRRSTGALEEGLEPRHIAEAISEEGTVGWLDLEAPAPEELHADDRDLRGRAPLLQAERLAVTAVPAGRPRGVAWRGGALGVALILGVAVLGAPGPAGALVGDLTTAGEDEAIEAGTASITQEDFAEEWQLRLPGGEEVAVSTPFSRLALAARQAAMKGESLSDKQRKEQIDRGRGRIQLVVTMHGRARDFARWYQPALVVRGREIKATFVQNERTPLRLEDGRYAARNVYVFPLEEISAGAPVTLVVRGAPPDHKEVLRSTLDFGKFR